MTRARPFAIELLRILVPIVIVAGGVGGYFALESQRQAPKQEAGIEETPLVRTSPVVEYDRPLEIEVDGLVVPYREIALSAEVEGRIVRKAKEARAGCYVAKDALLVEIDPRDYDLEVRRLKQDLVQAESGLDELKVELANTEALIALVAMFALLTLEFRSYAQPLLILLIIPFGTVGAVAGHLLMGMPLSLFSLFGLVALSGVVVNDSIVLIDFINQRVCDRVPLKTALLDAGSRRFRAVALTSLTTVAGLLPILLETSFQAQFLIPMATSLCFGLAFATLLVLIMVPTWYLIYFRLTQRESPLEGEPDLGEFGYPNGVELPESTDSPWEADSAPVARK